MKDDNKKRWLKRAAFLIFAILFGPPIGFILLLGGVHITNLPHHGLFHFTLFESVFVSYLTGAPAAFITAALLCYFAARAKTPSKGALMIAVSFGWFVGFVLPYGLWSNQLLTATYDDFAVMAGIVIPALLASMLTTALLWIVRPKTLIGP